LNFSARIGGNDAVAGEIEHMLEGDGCVHGRLIFWKAAPPAGATVAEKMRKTSSDGSQAQKAQNVFSVSQTGGAHNSGKSMAQKYKIMILEK